MPYQIFVERQSEKHFIATVIGVPSVSVAAATEAGAFTNAKIALASQLARGKFMTVEVEELTVSSINTSSMQNAGNLESDPTFDDWLEKLADIRRSANITN